ncbi:Sir2 histone deacetylase Hst2 [Savitreella phatthalungensis]
MVIINGPRQRREFEMDLNHIAALFKSGGVKRCVFCIGAGVSTAAGIPDFRSPKTGLYHNLKRLKLDYPEQVFEIDFFSRNPKPFYELAYELLPGRFEPTLTHAFMRLIYDKGMLLRVFTQNIDTLERRAGIPAEQIVEAHGSFATSRCIRKGCRQIADEAEVTKLVLERKTPHCTNCKGLVKPDIVFFGEGLPDVFFERLTDFRKADLLIVMGTSLQVQPFASLPDRVSRQTPRVLLNLEDVGHFDREMDVIHLDKCDESVLALAEACGWKDELLELHDEIKAAARRDKPDAEKKKKTPSGSTENVAKSVKEDEEKHSKDELDPAAQLSSALAKAIISDVDD